MSSLNIRSVSTGDPSTGEILADILNTKGDGSCEVCEQDVADLVAAVIDLRRRMIAAMGENDE